MERKRSMQGSLSMWLLVVGLVSQNLLTPVLSATHSFEGQKSFFSPYPHAGTPPTGSYGTPPTDNCDPTPPTRSHKTPPTYHGGSPHTPTPSTPRGGGYYPSPPTSGGSPPDVSPPTTPYVPTPETPTTPGAPPFLPDPNTPGTCDYWKHHPTLVWGVVGWFGLGSLGGAFGHSSLPGISPSLTCLDALSNTIPNGYGALYRDGTASLLNSLVSHKFPYSTQQVRDHFATGLGSDKAAATQAQLFKMANEGKLKSKA
uniref:Protodermal factor 1 n=1 Tax=Kalanchoe fedtschenkoi TaxID=63787 RepID=A0A7N0ZRR2_KALFE